MRRSKNPGLKECTRPTMSRASSALRSSKLEAIDSSASSREFHLLRRLAALGLGSPRDEFRITFQKSKVDLAHPLGEKLAASVGSATIATSGKFDKPRLRQIGPGPVQPVGEQRLIAAGQPELPFLDGDLQGLANFVLQPRNANLVVALPNRLQRRQHELLKTGHAHFFLRSPYPTQDYMRKTPNRVGSTPALSVAENASDRTRRVSRGVTMPSSQRRAVA